MIIYSIGFYAMKSYCCTTYWKISGETLPFTKNVFEFVLSEEHEISSTTAFILTFCDPFSTNVPLMDKPDRRFLRANCVKNTCGRVTFKVKMQVIDFT